MICVAEKFFPSRISSVNNSFDDAVEKNMEKIEEVAKTYGQENVIEGEKKEQEVANAQEMRERALESFTETKKRNEESEDSQKEKKKQSSVSETLI